MQKNLRIIIALLVLATAGVVGYVVLREGSQPVATDNQTDQTNSIDLSPSDESDNSITEQAKADGTIDQTIDEAPATSAEYSLSFTRTAFSSNSLTIGAIISGSDQATCVFNVSDESTSVETTVETLSTNGTTGCNASVDVSPLSENEEWVVEGYILVEDAQSEVVERIIPVTERQ